MICIDPENLGMALTDNAQIFRIYQHVYSNLVKT